MADIARSDNSRPIFVSSRLRLSANGKPKAFCFLILLNTIEKNNLAAGSSAIAGHHSSRVFRAPDNYLKDKLCCLLMRKFVLLAKNFNPLKIIKCGDVHPSPEPKQNYENFLTENSRHAISLSFVHINCQSINKKREQMKKLLRKVPDNTILA